MTQPQLLTVDDDLAVHTYRGIPIGAAPGVHETAFDVLRRLVPPCRVLDLGCGTGAFSQRLLDHGYDPTGVDVETKAYKAHGKMYEGDLNVGLPVAGTWTAIAAVELVEHLENPRALFRLAARHLAPRGWFLVTTPNIESVASRITFLFSGRFRWFAEGHYTSSGHITPLTQWQLDQIAAETGFTRSAVVTAATPVIGWRLRALSRLLSPFMRDAGEHDIRVCMYQQSSQGQT
jgi:SAM-dependent methyltransferase